MSDDYQVFDDEQAALVASVTDERPLHVVTLTVGDEQREFWVLAATAFKAQNAIEQLSLSVVTLSKSALQELIKAKFAELARDTNEGK